MGSGRPVQIFHIGSVGQLNPNATTVTNNYYGDQFVPKKGDGRKGNDSSPKVFEEKRQQILAYVKRVEPLLADAWSCCYDAFWQKVIEQPSVSAVIYTPGKQQNTTFNRKLVAQLLHYIGEKHKAFGPRFNATLLAEKLEGSRDASVRGELGFAVSDAGMVGEIEEIIGEIM